jgi:rubredoxin
LLAAEEVLDEVSRKLFCFPGNQAAQVFAINTNMRSFIMQSYECQVCGYVYNPADGDPEAGVPAGTSFEQLPEKWKCPVCGADKDQFMPVD